MYDVCHTCFECWEGTGQYCADAIHIGVMRTGSYQQYMVLPAIYTSRIPDGVSDEVAGPAMCSASTIQRALVGSRLEPENWVVFPGGGGGKRFGWTPSGVGIQGVQLAKAMGMRPIVVDSGAAKQKLYLELGAEALLDFKGEQDVPGRIKQVADGTGAHGSMVTAWQSYRRQ